MTISEWGSYLVEQMEGAKVPSGIAAWYIGGSSLAFKTRDAMLYLDLYAGRGILDDTPYGKFLRMIAVTVDPHDIRHADAMLSTHEHHDHCHRESLEPVHRNTTATFVGPHSSIDLMRKWGFDDNRLRLVEAGDTLEFGRTRVHAVPCKDFNAISAVSFIIEADGATAFDGGDTLYFDGMREIAKDHAIDVAFLPTCKNPPQAEIYMDPERTAGAAIALGAATLVPKRWELWKNWTLDPEEVGRHLVQKGAACKLQIMTLGDRLDIRR